jgi:NADPH2:quinone reductase
MRALICKEYGTADKLAVEEIDDPSPGAGEVLVAVKAAGLNFPDVLTIAGQYQVKTPPPFVPGIEAAGEVEAIGAGVRHFSVGDPVVLTTMTGAFAEKCVVNQAMAAPLPPGMSFTAGAGLSVTYSTTMHALRQSARLQAGETLLVLGAAGGVGSAAVEIGKAMGARVIAAASNPDKLAFAKEIGADDLVDYSADSLKDSVKALTDGHGVDVVYDPVGGDLAQAALRSLAWHGRYLVIGFAAGAIPDFPANLALLREASIIGVFWGEWARRHPELQASNAMEIGKMIADGRLSPRIGEVHELDDFVAAFDAITSRRAMGKVVLTME